jgi:hypothetical protein
MGRWTAAEIQQRAAHAESLRGPINLEIDQCMDLCMPWRRRQARNNGRDTFGLLFDSTGPTAVQRFGGRIQRDLSPPFQKWFNLEAGPMVPTPMVEKINLQLETATMMAHAVLDHSAFATASAEAYADLAIGTAAILGTEGPDRCPIIWQAAPPWAMGIEQGPFGTIDNVYWDDQKPIWHLNQLWPGADWGASIKARIVAGDRNKVRILQASYFDDDIDKWRIAIVSLENGEKQIVWETERRSNPWIIPRWWTTSGNPWGRGPLMLALPDIKTLNKTVEMVLRAAAYSLAPPLMVTHDGVVNPDAMRLAPNALIRVARTGGPNGRSIEPMEIGAKVDLAQIVLTDLRQSTNKTLLNEQLPPVTGAVRSASEIVERAKELQYDASAAFGRLNHELVPDVIRVVLDILDRKKVALIDWNKMKIDQLVMKVNVISPLARAQSLDDVQNTVQWLETMKAIGGDMMLAHASKIEDVGPYLGNRFGVSKTLIRPKAERDALEKAAAAAAAQQQQNGAPAQPGGPGPQQAAPKSPATSPFSGGATPAPFTPPPDTLSLPGPSFGGPSH